MIDNRHNSKSPIDSRLAGLRNEIMVLKMLRENTRISQSQLCALAGIGSSTASTIVARLRDKGFVSESPGTSTNRGPKPIILELNPKCRYIFAAEINPSYIFLGLFDFVGSIVDKIRISIGHDRSVEHVIDLLSINIPGLLTRNAIATDKVLGLGVTLSGSVLPEGIISLSSPMGWKNVHLKEKLQPYFKFPVFIYNNRVRVLAEIANNPELDSKNILYLNVADGVGSTIFMDGKLIIGSTGRYGEIGHIVIDPNGPVCGCGNTGCLEAFISGPALIEKIRKELPSTSDQCFSEALTAADDTLNPEDILSSWQRHIDNDIKYAILLREYVSHYFCDIAATLINCYDPNIVMLAGYVCDQINDYLAENIHKRIETAVYESSLRKIEIIPASTGKDALIKGVASAVLQQTEIFS